MLTCKSIVVNMHKRVMFFLIHSSNLRQKTKVKETTGTSLLRQRF